MKKLFFTLFLFIIAGITINAQKAVDNNQTAMLDPYLWGFDDYYYLGDVEPSEEIIKIINIHSGGPYACWDISVSDSEFFTIVNNEGGDPIDHFCGSATSNYVQLKITITCPDDNGYFQEYIEFTIAGDQYPYNFYNIAFQGTVVPDDLDTEPPTKPQNLRTTTLSQDRFTLEWDPSSDNVGVKGYRIWKNGSYHTWTSGTSYLFTGLSSQTTYNIKIQAFDNADNKSAYAYKTVQTPAYPFTANIIGPIMANNTSYYTWSAIVNGGDIGVPPYTYLWKYNTNGSNTYTYTWATTQSNTAQMPDGQDLYLKLIVTDANGLTRTSFWETFNTGGFKPKSLNSENKPESYFEDIKKEELSIFPNPGNGYYRINKWNGSESLEVSVYTITGQFILSKSVSNNNEAIDISDQPNGIYIFKIYT